MSNEIRVFKADAGVKWFKAGWQIFKTQPITFIFMHLLIAVLSLMSVLLPVLQVISAFVTPFLLAGFYQAVIAKQQGSIVNQTDLFKPFTTKGNRVGLVRVAVYQIAAGILMALLSSVLFADTAELMASATFNPEDPAQLADLFASISMSSVALMALVFAFYLTAFAYVVPLVYFKGESNIFAAIKTSLLAFYHNMAPLTVYGLIVMLLVLACMPLSFIPLLVLLPICYISFFVSFQAILMPIVPPAKTQVTTKPSDKGRFDA